MNGMVKLKITVADPSMLLSELHQMRIPMEQVLVPDELTLQVCIRRQDYRAVIAFAEKRGGECKTAGKYGLFWDLVGITKRPMLLIGMGIILALTFFLPTRLLFYRVEGNHTVPARQIIAFAAENGLEFGAIRREIRSEKIKNALLKAIPELEWVGINTAGCVATISVRERQNQAEPPMTSGVSNIIAARNGTVQELIVTAGSALVKPGQEVTAGQVLISGYTDCGLMIRAERAQGEIYAITSHQLTVLVPDYSSELGGISSETKNFSLIFGKKRINFFESGGNLDTGCVKMYEENYVTLPGGFVLPIGIATEHCIYYNPTETDISQEQQLLQGSERYLLTQMVAGRILSREEEIFRENGVWCLEGSYECLEMIGKEQSEEIITP